MKIGIVNDMAMAVAALRWALKAAPQHEVVWTAADGAQAVELCARQTPDLVLMDMIMPGMDGVEATRQIMVNSPCAILIVTASIDANTRRVFEAMGHGALDVIDTPVLGAGGMAPTVAPLLAKIDTIGRLIGRPRPREPGPGASAPAGGSARRLVAIGASAGGPAALARVLQGLPADFPAAVVVVQHVDGQFAAGMAEWLGQSSPWPVRVAHEEAPVAPGTVWLAGAGEHLVLKSADRLGYTREPPDQFYQPSVDVCFQSVVQHWPGRAIGVLLTGIGCDGAAGLKALRDQGHHTIAQDQASSAVYGMPKMAAELGAAVDILALERIAPRLCELCNQPVRGPTPCPSLT
jgi:chemotaxis response regulator CheB